MISKASDKTLLSGINSCLCCSLRISQLYRNQVRKAHFFLHSRDSRLPTGTILEQLCTTYLCDAEDYQTELFINLTTAQHNWRWRASNRPKRSSGRFMTDNRVAVLIIESWFLCLVKRQERIESLLVLITDHTVWSLSLRLMQR